METQNHNTKCVMHLIVLCENVSNHAQNYNNQSFKNKI